MLWKSVCFLLGFISTGALLASGAPSLSKKLTLLPNSLKLSAPFNYIVLGYNEASHHHRTPFAVAPNGKSFVAWEVNGGTVHVTSLNANLKSIGETKLPGYEPSGLVAHNDGFAILLRRKAATSNGETVAVLVRVRNGKEVWATPLNGPSREKAAGFASSSPVLAGDLSWNGKYYGAYFVVHGYTADFAGHYGDSIQYVNANGGLYVGPFSTSWGCSHNEGIAIHPTSSLPFLTLCSNDWHTGIFLNTDTRSMSGPKISNDLTWAGYGGEPFGGESGSYSNIAALSGGRYLVAFQSRGASALKQNSDPEVIDVTARWDVHNVAVAVLKDKSTPLHTVPQKPGAAGDTNVNWITKSATVDHVNVRIAPYGKDHAVVSWEQVSNPKCNAGTCTGQFVGTYLQIVDVNGRPVGSPLVTKATIAGDMQVMPNGDVVWPYVTTNWDLSGPGNVGKTTKALSFARLRV